MWRLLPVWLSRGLVPFGNQFDLGGGSSEWRDALAHTISYPGNLEPEELYTMTAFLREYKSGEEALSAYSTHGHSALSGRPAIIHGRRIFAHRCLCRMHEVAEIAAEDGVIGIQKSDYSTLMELVLNVVTRPSEVDVETVETFGKQSMPLRRFQQRLAAPPYRGASRCSGIC